LATPTPGSGQQQQGGSYQSNSFSTTKDQYGFTDEGRKDLRARIRSDLREIMGTDVKDVPEALFKEALKSRGQFSVKEIATWLRQKTPKLYLKSALAKQERKDVMRTFQSLLGNGAKAYDINSDKGMAKLLDDWQLADNHDLFGIFKKFINNSQTFKDMYPGFGAWFQKSGQSFNFKNPAEAVDKFKDVRSQYEEWYRIKTKGATVDEKFILDALRGNWQEAEFDTYLHNQAAWKAGAGAARDTEFKQAWDRLFYGTDMVGKYDEALRTKFLNDDKLDFDTMVETDIKNQDYFAKAFPGWKTWQDKQVAAGVDPGKITVAGWRSDETDRVAAAKKYREMYALIVGDPNAIADDNLIQQAVDGNWSQSYFELYFKKNDPAYKNTADYRSRSAAFSQYWKNMLGDSYQVDQNLVDEYAGSDINDPQTYFDQIRNSSTFQNMFPEWDAFSTGRSAAGQNASANPLLYNEYRTAFYKAFADNGLKVPDGYESSFFHSGQDSQDFANHVTTFAKDSEAFNWQTGEPADMGTALDLGDKTKGGLLRKRLAESIAQQKTYMNSQFNQFQRDENSGLSTRVI